jgi:hypothetical protein
MFILYDFRIDSRQIVIQTKITRHEVCVYVFGVNSKLQKVVNLSGHQNFFANNPEPPIAAFLPSERLTTRQSVV